MTGECQALLEDEAMREGDSGSTWAANSDVRLAADGSHFPNPAAKAIRRWSPPLGCWMLVPQKSCYSVRLIETSFTTSRASDGKWWYIDIHRIPEPAPLFFKNMSYVVTHFDSDPIDSSCIWQVSLTKWLSRINCDSLSCIIHWVLGLCSTVSILYRYTHTDYTHSIPILYQYTIIYPYYHTILCIYTYICILYTVYIYTHTHFSTTLLHRGFSFADPIMEPGTWALTASIFSSRGSSVELCSGRDKWGEEAFDARTDVALSVYTNDVLCVLFLP